VPHFLSELFVALFSPGEADDLNLTGGMTVVAQVEQCRHELALRQVARSAEDHDRTGFRFDNHGSLARSSAPFPGKCLVRLRSCTTRMRSSFRRLGWRIVWPPWAQANPPSRACHVRPAPDHRNAVPRLCRWWESQAPR